MNARNAAIHAETESCTVVAAARIALDAARAAIKTAGRNIADATDAADEAESALVRAEDAAADRAIAKLDA